MIKIGNIFIPGNLILAPMAGITNSVYRKYAINFGADLVYSEMVSDMALIYNNEQTQKMVMKGKEEKILIVQLFGSNPITMAKAAKILEEMHVDAIDINMGCPVNKVIKANAGSYLLKDIDQAVAIADSVVKAVKIPVTVKMRLGYTRSTIVAVELAKKLEEVGVKLIAVHGRTRDEFYSGHSTWDEIRKVKESVKIPVIANGDVNCGEDAVRILEETNCDGIMIGRGSLGNPWIFEECKLTLLGKPKRAITINERLDIARKHIEDLINLKGEWIGSLEARALACYYIKGMKNSTKYKPLFVKCASKKDFNEIFDLIESDNQLS